MSALQALFDIDAIDQPVFVVQVVLQNVLQMAKEDEVCSPPPKTLGA